MRRAYTAAGLSALAALTAVMIALELTTTGPVVMQATPIFAADSYGRNIRDDPLRLDALDGPAPSVAYGVHEDVPIMVLTLPHSGLVASAAFHGYNTAQYAMQHPNQADALIVAYGARSTHHGCGVGLLEDADVARTFDADYGGATGLLLDVCHHGQWDPYDLAINHPDTPAPRPLDAFWIATMPDGVLGVVERYVQDAPRDADRDVSKAFRIVGQTS